MVFWTQDSGVTTLVWILEFSESQPQFLEYANILYECSLCTHYVCGGELQVCVFLCVGVDVRLCACSHGGQRSTSVLFFSSIILHPFCETGSLYYILGLQLELLVNKPQLFWPLRLQVQTTVISFAAYSLLGIEPKSSRSFLTVLSPQLYVNILSFLVWDKLESSKRPQMRKCLHTIRL